MIERTFTRLTQRLLTEKRVSGFHIQGPAQRPTEAEARAFDTAFEGKRALKGGGRNMPWGDWLIESLFPILMYEQNGRSLKRMLADPRAQHDLAGFTGGESWNNSFCRMARPRAKVPMGFVLFMLERMRGKYRGMPQYFFDVEYPEWVLEPLVGRPDIPKTVRTSLSCVMLYGFQYLNDALHISVILRHMNWSHSWGDVYGGERALRAVCDELKVKQGGVTIFANSASMDTPKFAKRYLKEIGNA